MIITQIEKELFKVINGLKGNYGKDEVDLGLKVVKLLSESLSLSKEIESYKRLEPLRKDVYGIFSRRLDKIILTIKQDKADEQSYIALANEVTNIYSLLDDTGKFYANVKEIRYNNVQEDSCGVLDGVIGDTIMDSLRKL